MWKDLIKQFIEGFKAIANESENTFKIKAMEFEGMVQKKMYSFKRSIFSAVLELILFSTSIIFIIVGGIFFLRRFFSLDILFLVSGLILFNVVLLFGKFKK